MVSLIFCESYDNNIALSFTVKGFDFLLVFIKLFDSSCNNAPTDRATECHCCRRDI